MAAGHAARHWRWPLDTLPDIGDVRALTNLHIKGDFSGASFAGIQAPFLEKLLLFKAPNLTHLPELSRFPLLRDFELKGGGSKQKILSGPPWRLPQLRRLKLSDMALNTLPTFDMMPAIEDLHFHQLGLKEHPSLSKLTKLKRFTSDIPCKTTPSFGKVPDTLNLTNFQLEDVSSLAGKSISNLYLRVDHSGYGWPPPKSTQKKPFTPSRTVHGIEDVRVTHNLEITGVQLSSDMLNQMLGPDVTKLKTDSCGLQACPDFSQWPLEVLELRERFLTGLPADRLPKTLQKLKLVSANLTDAQLDISSFPPHVKELNFTYVNLEEILLIEHPSLESIMFDGTPLHPDLVIRCPMLNDLFLRGGIHKAWPKIEDNLGTVTLKGQGIAKTTYLLPTGETTEEKPKK